MRANTERKVPKKKTRARERERRPLGLSGARKMKRRKAWRRRRRRRRRHHQPPG